MDLIMINIHGYGTEMIEGFGGIKSRGVDTVSVYPTGWINPTEGGVISDGFGGSYIEGHNG